MTNRRNKGEQMKAMTKARLEEAQKYCDDNDKSTEFMIQYMQDFAGVDFDCVMSFLKSKAREAPDRLLDAPSKPSDTLHERHRSAWKRIKATLGHNRTEASVGTTNKTQGEKS